MQVQQHPNESNWRSPVDPNELIELSGIACAVEGTGASAVAATLHAAAALLKTSPYWDWFINLSASDYPAITQDGEHLVSAPCN